MRKRWFAIADAIGIMGLAVRAEARVMQPTPRIDALHSTRTRLHAPCEFRTARASASVRRATQIGGRP